MRIVEIGRRQILELIDTIADRGAVTLARRCHAICIGCSAGRLGAGIIEREPNGIPAQAGRGGAAQARAERRRTAHSHGAAAQQIGWPMGSAIQLLMLTAARRDEIGELQW